MCRSFRRICLMLDDVEKIEQIEMRHCAISALLRVQTICESLYIHTFTSREDTYARSSKRIKVIPKIRSYD